MSTFLFSGDWGRTEDMVMAAIESPLGTVRLDASINGDLLSAYRASTYVSNIDARLFVWNTPFLLAELMVCKPHLDLPSGMNVTDCRAAVWRVRAEMQPIIDYTLTCRLESLGSQRTGSPCSGQGLEAQEWSNGKINMTIGTQDVWAMVMYRNDGGILPDRWAQELWGNRVEDVSLVEYANDGFVLRPPGLEPGEIVQFQFVVAWAFEPGGDIANWYAVDLPPRNIISTLPGAGS